MPTPIKLFDLVSIPGTRHLWPKEFDGLVKTWEEAKSNDQLGIIADWLDDNDEPELAHAFRWCYKRNIPFAGSDCRIENKHLPLCLHKVHPMARKKIKTAQSIFEQLRADMQGLTSEERVKLVELVLADPDFGNGPTRDLLHLEMQGIAARVEAREERAKNSRRSQEPDGK